MAHVKLWLSIGCLYPAHLVRAFYFFTRCRVLFGLGLIFRHNVESFLAYSFRVSKGTFTLIGPPKLNSTPGSLVFVTPAVQKSSGRLLKGILKEW